MNFKEFPSNPVRNSDFSNFSYRIEGTNVTFAEGQGQGVDGRPQEEAAGDAQSKAPALASRATGLRWGSPHPAHIEGG